MKLVEYAPYVLGFLILMSLALLVAGVATAEGAGVPRVDMHAAKHLATIAHEDITIRITSQNDAIEPRDYGVDAGADKPVANMN